MSGTKGVLHYKIDGDTGGSTVGIGITSLYAEVIIKFGIRKSKQIEV